MWDNVYRVPSLLFRASLDSGRALEAQELLLGGTKEEASAAAAVRGGGGYGGPAVTALEHPHTGSTFYAVHPCNTAACMGEVLWGGVGAGGGDEGGGAATAAATTTATTTTTTTTATAATATTTTTTPRPLNYLVLWLSIVAPLVGLKIPPELAASCLATDKNI